MKKGSVFAGMENKETGLSFSWKKKWTSEKIRIGKQKVMLQFSAVPVECRKAWKGKEFIDLIMR